jgi:hypothetical protein
MAPSAPATSPVACGRASGHRDQIVFDRFRSDRLYIAWPE